MKFSSSFAVLASLTASCAMADMSVESVTSSLINGLKAANLTAMATLAANHSSTLVSVVEKFGMPLTKLKLICRFFSYHT
jgi:hypothetical protein